MLAFLKRFSDESTLHGVKEMYYADSIIEKTIWGTVIYVGFVLTIVQSSLVILNYVDLPTKTEIEFMDDTFPFRYPVITLKPYYFTEWVDMDKVEKLGFDLDTFLYTMSHFNKIYTRRQIDLVKAIERMKRIMKDHAIPSMYDFGKFLSLHVPEYFSNERNVSVVKYFDKFGDIVYVFKEEHTEDIEYELDYEFYELTSFVDFKESKFNKNMLRIFGYDFKAEFVEFKNFEMDYTSDKEFTINQSFPIQMNPVSADDTVTSMNILSDHYEMMTKAAYFQWMSTPKFFCIENKVEEAIFNQECYYSCAEGFRFDFSTPKITIVKFNTTQMITEPKPNEAADQCKQKCSKYCNQWSHEYSVSLMPSLPVVDNVVRDSVRVTYLAKYRILITRLVPLTTTENLFGNIGGFLGLWLGGSVMSLLQGFYIFFCAKSDKRWEDEFPAPKVKKTSRKTTKLAKSFDQLKKFSEKF